MADKFNFGEALKNSGRNANPFNVTLRKVTRQVKLGKKERLPLLDNVSFYIKPGTMTLVLGAPGCGKTTLFKVLANHGSKRKYAQTGQVLFNGKPANRKTHHQSIAYVAQEDIHFPTLTVRETLQFSLNCQASPDMQDQAKSERVDQILQLLDLKHVQDTYVGNEFIRGISGGQRKRVTIGVSLTSNPSIILLDEPTTGLDANTALEVISAIRTVCDNLQTPVVAALLQPSPEICELFDNLLILSKGRVGYFGSYKNAIPYFSRFGLEGGKFQSDPEFLQEAIEYSSRYSEKSTDEMINLYQESPEYNDVMRIIGGDSTVDLKPNLESQDDTEEVRIIPQDIIHDDESDPVVEHTYPTSFWYQTGINMKREWTMVRRDIATLRSRFAKKVILGLIAGSLFYNLPYVQAGLRTRMAILFFANLYLVMGNIGIISPFYRERAVFYSQREQKYYSPLTYFLSKTILEIPIIIVECIVFGCIIYWMVGLNPEANRFVYFLLVLMASDLFSIVFCRFASTFIAMEQVAGGITPAIFGICVLFTGFIIPPPSIPDWWIWIYYLSPFHYALEGCLVNELVGTTYHCTSSETVPPSSLPSSLPYPLGFDGYSVCPVTTGEQQLVSLSMHTDFWWRWIHLLILLCFSLFFIGLTFIGAVRVNHSGKLMKSKKSKNGGVEIEVKSEKNPEAQKGHGAFMSWENLNYAVDAKKGKEKIKLTLLDGITGYVRPGMLMALMGPSGAGKSTLLDVLANRKTGGYTEGKILINGSPRDRFFNRFSAYVEQQDLLMPLATVYESVLFSAQVRLPKEMSQKEKDLRIQETLHILDLHLIQNLLAENLSMEQRKRLNIAVELVSDPQLLFLDEPTSGLDSQAALKVMDVVKRVAGTGRSVICTIHQPSLAVFSYFDHLLLLKRGGKTVYFGPTGKDCSDVLAYFSTIGWECEPKRNPADFILDAAAITMDNQDLLLEGQQDPETAFSSSPLKNNMESHIHEIPDGFVSPSFNKQYASSFSMQLNCNLKREWANVRRRTQDLRTRIMRSLVMGIIIGTLFLQLNHDQDGASGRFGLIFIVILLLGTGANNIIPNIVGGRAVFYREQAAGAYRCITYLISILVTEFPITLICALLFSILAYFISGLSSTADQFFFFTWILFIYGSLTVSFVMFLSLATPNGEIAAALAGVFTSLFALFGGFIIIKSNIPDYWIWLYYINFLHYPLEALVVNEMHGNVFGCPNNKGAIGINIISANTTKFYCPITSGNLMLKVVDFNPDNRLPNMGITIAFWGALMFCSFLALRFIRHIKR